LPVSRHIVIWAASAAAVSGNWPHWQRCWIAQSVDAGVWWAWSALRVSAKPDLPGKPWRWLDARVSTGSPHTVRRAPATTHTYLYP
jgi:hypothetical protein